jgi:aminoglycoside/choline kinase family phosphotransferase
MLWTDAGTIESYIAINSDGDDNAFVDIPQLKKALGENYGGKIEFIGARGSDRIFFRADDKVVVIYDDAKRGENARYAAHARWLAERGVKVPALIADLPEMKTLVFENAGVDGMKLQGYVNVAEALAEFNKLDATGIELEPPMDAAMWRWERELFREHCLEGHFGLEMPADVEAELERVANMLMAEPMALVHRDFQTTNVLWRNGDFKFIDFQGMRLGPAVYDLASLVYDPYVKLSERERAAIVKVYADATARGGEISAVLPFAAVERLVQCLGAYGRLASVGQGQFKKYILPALENLLAAADEAGLDAIGALAEELIHLETESGKKASP